MKNHSIKKKLLTADSKNPSSTLKGKPRPVATWYKDGQPLDPKMVNVRNSNVDSILFIRSAERDHSGKYELVLQIENMEDRATLEIRVIGEAAHRLFYRESHFRELNL